MGPKHLSNFKDKMNKVDFKHIDEGKEWIDNILFLSRNIFIPEKYSYLKRRIFQIRCNELFTEEHTPQKIKFVFRFILGAGYIVFLLLRSRFLKLKISSSFSIWDSDISPHVSMEIFNTFIDSQQIISKNTNSFLVVKSTKNQKMYSSVMYCKDPIYETISLLNISLSDSLELIKNIFSNFFTYLQISSHCIHANKLFKDFLIEPIIKLYVKKGMVKFYRTNTNYSNQEFWCESIDFNTIWYSINSLAFQFKKQPKLMPENPLYYFQHFGTSWTWNQAHSEWLKHFYVHQVMIVGPIMFYFLTNNVKNKSNKKRLIIFDVTPHEEMYARKKIAQQGFNYYNEDICIQFLNDILDAFDNPNWEIVLKPKRKYSKNHSRKYIDFIQTIVTERHNFTVLNPDNNLFNEISKSDIVITIPFSSPFDISKSLGVPSIYYDPSGEIDFSRMGYSVNDYVTDLISLKKLAKHNEPQ